MFGRQDDQSNSQIPNESIDNVINDDQQQSGGAQPQGQPWQHPGLPVDGGAVTPVDNVVTPAGSASNDTGAPALPSVGTPDPVQDVAAPAAASDDLIDIKQQALNQLSPLVGHLEQSPEEKFRTTMMMLQASDDQSLVKTAFEAAQQITDEKARAQALLDVVNEINYFTQHGPAPQNQA